MSDTDELETMLAKCVEYRANPDGFPPIVTLAFAEELIERVLLLEKLVDEHADRLDGMTS